MQSLAQAVDHYGESVLRCCMTTSISFAVAMLIIRSTVSGLMEMHRSKTALQTIRKTYSFTEKLCLKHVWEKCLHAVSFCHCLIILHHCIFFLFLIGLILALLGHIWSGLMPIVACHTLIFIHGVFFPSVVMYFLLDRYPFQKRRHEFRFKKYHNTEDHTSLW